MVSNLNSQYNVAMQAGVPVNLQGVDAEKVKKSVDNSYLANRAKASEETNPYLMLGVGTGVWYGLSQGMDKFNPKCAGKYEDSILGKVGGWGDKISTKTYVGKKVEQAIRWFDKKFEKLSHKSKIAYTLRNHHTNPEWSFAKTPGAGLHGFLAMDMETVCEEFLKPISEHPAEEIAGIPLGKKYNAFQKLEQYGMSQDAIKTFKESLNGKDFQTQALALQKKELELLGIDNKIISKIEGKTGLKGLQKLARNLKIKKLGFSSVKEYESLKGKFLDNPDKVMKALEKATSNGKDLKISIWREGGKVRKHLFGRTVSLQEYLNKYYATLGKKNTTTLGRMLPKAMGWFLEGTTNRFAGGKFAVIMQAGIFADMLINTFKAPKGEKGKTFAERFANDFTYFMAMTIGIMGMHKVGGFKYAGLDKAGVETYRKALDLFNKNVKAGVFADKAAYKAASKAVDDALGTKNIKNPITKLLHKIGKLINIGNERKLAYVSKSKHNLNWLRKCKNGNILGVPIRFLIPMMVVSPFLAKIVTKGAHAIFGRPTKSVLDEEEEVQEEQPEQIQQTQAQQRSAQKPDLRLHNSPTNLLNPYIQAALAQQALANRPFVSNNSPTNLLRMYKEGHPYKETIPSVATNSPVDAQTAQNSQNMTQQGNNNPQNPAIANGETSVNGSDKASNGVNNTKNTTTTTSDNSTQSENINEISADDPNRSYVPSSAPVTISNNYDPSQIDKAMKNADAAEKLAMETLSMRN